MKKAKERIDIERLVTWALLDQGLGWAGGQSSEVGFAELGTRIDVSGVVRSPSIALQTDDDAHVVLAVIMRLPEKARELVMRHGRIGKRPDWCEEGAGQFVQRRSANGKLAWLYEKPGDRRSKKTPIMEWDGGWRPEQVEFWRAEYSVWWQSLADMVAPLNRQLDHHEATGPKTHKAPWDSPAPTVFGEDGKAMEKRARTDGMAGRRQGYVNRRGVLHKLAD